MRPQDLHPFLDLAEPDRSRWIASFCSSPDESPYPSAPFAVLHSGEDPGSWLIDQYRRALRYEGWAPRLRQSLALLFAVEIDRLPGGDRAQAVSYLLDFAGECGAVELGPILRAWVRTHRFSGAKFRLGSRSVSLHRRLWEVLIAWRQTETMEYWLGRDFGVPDCSALCFAELGRLKPGEAIRRIPGTIDWPKPYWCEVLSRFFEDQVRGRDLLGSFKTQWKRCFEDFGAHSLLRFEKRGGYLLLRQAGIDLTQESDYLYLSAGAPPQRYVRAVIRGFIDWGTFDREIVAQAP